MNGLDTIHKGLGSVGVIELTDKIPDFQYSEVIKLLIQVIIGIATLIHYFKPPKQNNTTN